MLSIPLRLLFFMMGSLWYNIVAQNSVFQVSLCGGKSLRTFVAEETLTSYENYNVNWLCETVICVGKIVVLFTGISCNSQVWLPSIICHIVLIFVTG